MHSPRIKFNFTSDIGESIPVNETHGIYYSKTFDKFYRLIDQASTYREMREYKHHAHYRIQYDYDKTTYCINTTKFRANQVNDPNKKYFFFTNSVYYNNYNRNQVMTV